MDSGVQDLRSLMVRMAAMAAPVMEWVLMAAVMDTVITEAAGAGSVALGARPGNT